MNFYFDDETLQVIQEWASRRGFRRHATPNERVAAQKILDAIATGLNRDYDDDYAKECDAALEKILARHPSPEKRAQVLVQNGLEDLERMGAHDPAYAIHHAMRMMRRALEEMGA